MADKKNDLKLLIVAAHSSELLPLVKLGRKYQVVRNGIGYLAAGVGPVAATFGLTHFLEDYRPQNIIAIGTAGIINDKKFKIGDVVIGKSVSTESGLKECYTPKAQSGIVTLPHPLPYIKGGGSKFPPLKVRGGSGRGYQFVNIFSPQEITRSPAWQKQFLKSGFDVEHLESFAFTFVAKKFRIPLTIVLGLSNVIDGNAHHDWINNQAQMVRKVCRAASNMGGILLQRI